MKYIAQKTTAKLKFCCCKTCSSFFNYVMSKSLDIALTVSSSERRRIVLLMESIQISPCSFVCKREEC